MSAADRKWCTAADERMRCLWPTVMERFGDLALLVTAVNDALHHAGMPAFMHKIDVVSRAYRLGIIDRSTYRELAGPYRRKAIPVAVRREVLARDQDKCLCCGTVKDLQLDHIVPVALGGGDDIENLQTLCRSCNHEKGTRRFDFRRSFHVDVMYSKKLGRGWLRFVQDDDDAVQLDDMRTPEDWEDYGDDEVADDDVTNEEGAI